MLSVSVPVCTDCHTRLRTDRFLSQRRVEEPISDVVISCVDVVKQGHPLTSWIPAYLCAARCGAETRRR